MKIVINSVNNQYLETINFENLENINATLKKFSNLKVPLEAKIFAINESISARQLSKLKNNFGKINIFSLTIYSNK